MEIRLLEMWRAIGFGVIARCASVMTVLLSVALIAVSAYAAKTEPPVRTGYVDVADARTADEPAAELAAAPAEYGGTGVETMAVLGVEEPSPTAVLRYAAPSGGEALPLSTGGRNNLSPEGRTWPVLSLKPGTVDPASVIRAGADIPADQLGVMLQVGRETNLPWQIFAAVAKVESDLGRNMATSSAGAVGYGQFLPSTWYDYGQGGDPYDFRDVIPAMGRYLLDVGAADDIPAALYAYNHSWAYVAQVLSYAGSYGYAGAANIPAGFRDGLIWPAMGPISSYFGAAHPLGIDIDLTAVPGSAIIAAHSGAVLFAGGDPCCSYGRYVILSSQSGLMTLYGHFEMLAVATGQTVRQGEPLGIAGCTGYCTGTHLHFEVFDAGVRQDPLRYLP